MFCISALILFDGIGEKPCAEHRESNSKCYSFCDLFGGFDIHEVLLPQV